MPDATINGFSLGLEKAKVGVEYWGECNWNNELWKSLFSYVL